LEFYCSRRIGRSGSSRPSKRLTEGDAGRRFADNARTMVELGKVAR